MLELTDVRAGYDGSTVLNGMTLKIGKGEKVALLGGNGVGKSTTMKVITGLVKPFAGKVLFDGEDLSKLPAHRIAELGIAMVPEGRRIFPALTVWENLQVGSFLKRQDPAFVRRTLDRVVSVFPVLGKRRKQLGATLSGGEQQMLAVARALLSGPRLLLLDEPSLGLAPIMVREVFKVLESSWDADLSYLIAEQNASLVLKVCDRGCLVQRGRVILEGEASDLQTRPELHVAYLGHKRKTEGGAVS